MTILVRSTGWIIVLSGIFCPAATALSGDRTAEQILQELDALKVPLSDRTKIDDQKYLQEFLPRRAQIWSKRDALILELYKVAASHQRIPKLMAERWNHFALNTATNLESLKEIDEILARDPNPKLRIEGMYVKAVAKIRFSPGGSPDLSGAEEFIKLAPNDHRGAALLRMASRGTRDDKIKAAIQDRAIIQYPDSPYAKNSMRRKLTTEPDQKTKQALEAQVLETLPGSDLAQEVLDERRRRDAIGKPFHLVFVDAIHGSTISIERLAGKVVVIDFWATWCGPCVAEMPQLKELYAKYHDMGVEFIGVSLNRPKNEGGLESLERFVADKAIAWPQYYQGDGGLGGFSKSWGIHKVPTVFVVNADGTLYSVDARGKLDTIIPELLLKRKISATAGKGPLESK
jgi:thiol-disulfide isomerase/thioredoxin